MCATSYQLNWARRSLAGLFNHCVFSGPRLAAGVALSLHSISTREFHVNPLNGDDLDSIELSFLPPTFVTQPTFVHIDKIVKPTRTSRTVRSFPICRFAHSGCYRAACTGSGYCNVDSAHKAHHVIRRRMHLI